jgi:hypothetical protein
MHFRTQTDGHSCGRHALNEALQILGGQLGGVATNDGYKFTQNDRWTSDRAVFVDNTALTTFVTTDMLYPALPKDQAIINNFYTDAALEKALVELSGDRLSLIQVNTLDQDEDNFGLKLPEEEPNELECHIWFAKFNNFCKFYLKF